MKELLEKAKKDSIFKLERPSTDFIPYACHYDANTILTKNGELMQTIRIAGFSEKLVGEKYDLRGIIRKAILTHINSNKYAVWFHTVRRKANLDPPSHYNHTFARDTHETWCNKNYWRDKYVNELYLTVLHAGESFKTKTKNPLDFISIRSTREKHLDKLEKAKTELYEVVNGMLETLKLYGAIRLTIRVDRHGARSELLEFLTKIIHLHEKRMDVPILSLDEYLATGKAAFGDKSFQIVEENKKYFGAIFSIKDYQDFSEELIDGFLRLPQEFVITQTLSFKDAKLAKKSFEYSYYILNISKDNWLKEKSGLQKIMDSDKGSPIDFSSSQLTVMIVGEDKDYLEVEVLNSIRKFNKLGLVAVREDLNMELCFWSQLPGNFNFIRRNIDINTNRVAAFASLHNSPKGKLENPWGSAITLFRLDDGTPYFFNFHDDEVGHTFISGPKSSGKATLMNFVLCEASKYNPRILFIDQFITSKLLVKALGGRHKTILTDKHNNQYSFNPLSLSESESSKTFLIKWLSYLLYPLDYKPTKQEMDKIAAAVDKMYKLPKAERRLSYADKFFDDQEILEKLTDWRGEGKYAELFDNAHDDFHIHYQVTGYNIGNVIPEGDRVIVPLMSYFIHRFNIALDGSPAILLMNDAHRLLQSSIFKEDLEMWLDYLTSMNAIVIFMKDTSDLREGSLNVIAPHKFSTLMFMPDPEAPERYKITLKLTDEEINKVKKMKILYRHFMIKQGKEVVVAELNLDGLDYALSALTGRKEYLEMMEEAIKEAGDDPTKWLLPFYLKVGEYIEQKNNKAF